ncbi:MAG: 30S ribosomal protein S20 [Christensenellales bacterium]|jgi:small subunit ribosomal protein S20
MNSRRYEVPNIKSQIKRVKTNEKANLSNNSKRTRIRNAIKKFTLAAQAKDIELCDKLYKETISILDKAYYDGIYHKNTIARKKSAVSKLYNEAKK